MEPVLNRILAVFEARIASDSDLQVIVVRDGRSDEAMEKIPTMDSPDALVAVHQMNPVPAPELNRHGNPPSVGFKVQINVQRFTKPDSSSEKDYALKLNQLAADVVALITRPAVNPEQWHNMDGNAILATIGAARFIQPGGAFQHGIAVPFLVSFRVAENDHTEVR